MDAGEEIRRMQAAAAAGANGHDTVAGVLLWHQIKGSPATDTLVKRLMGTASLVVIAGPTGSGKTFVAIDGCAHVVMGWPWFGRKVTHVGALYVGAEGQAGLFKRIQALKRHHRIADDASVPFALYPSPIDLVTDASGAKQIVAYIEALNAIFPVKIGVVVIDTLARCFGGGDESATKDMNAFVMRCGTIVNETGATVIVVHHFGKDESRGMRGSIALKAAADTVIEVTGLDGVRTARVEKQKDGTAGDSFTFTLQPVDLEPDADGERVTSCVVVPSDAPAAKKGTKAKPPPAEYLKARDYLADVIADAGETVASMTIPANTKVTTVERWRERLEKRGLYEPGDSGRQWFQRVRNRLIGDSIIAMDGPHVWIVKRRDGRDAA
jgi:AAA domain